MGDNAVGSLPPPLAVKCEVYPAYRIRIEQKGGKPTSAFPQLIHGYGARSNIFHNHFFWGNLLNISPNSTAMTSRSNQLMTMTVMTSSFPRGVFYLRHTYSYRNFLQKIQSIFNKVMTRRGALEAC